MSTRIQIAFVASSGVGVAFIVASCGFDPRIADGAFACASDGTCPPGFVCATDRRCHEPGKGPTGGGDGGPEDDSSTSGPNGPFVIGGELTGLKGTGLVLQDVGTDDLPLAQNGPFSFATRLPKGALYNVTVSSQPSEPSQTCAVAKAAGVVAGDVRDVAVTCQTATYSVGGTVLGAVGTGLVLANNGGEDHPVNAAGAFAFGKKIESGATYDVTIKTQPAGGGPCNVSGGTGTVGVTDVTSVVVNCTPGTFTVGGKVANLVGSVVVQLNGANDRTLTANGTFAFPTALATSTSYAVTVKTEPAYPPRAQTCVVDAGNGTIGTANVTNVSITCTTKTFTVGGSVTNLNGTVQVTNNGGDPIDVKTSGAFTFPTPIASGSTYAVAVSKQPDNQTCTVANATGTVANGAITNVAISCTDRDPGILCGAAHCDPKTTICCVRGQNDKSAPSCEATGETCTPRYTCDSTGDCANIAGTICCGTLNPSGVLIGASCTAYQNCVAANGPVLCDPKIGGECANGGACKTGQLANPDFVRMNYGVCK